MTDADSSSPTVPNAAGTNVCLTCGACCAFFRVSFYWSEAMARGLPEELTEKVNDFIACMAGTGSVPARCVALDGTVGEKVSCSIYSRRPAPCHSVQAGDEKCNRARERHGLPPLPAV